MKVVKIDITQTLMEVEHPVVKFADIDGIMDFDYYYTPVEHRKKSVYEVISVTTPRRGEKKNFLVKMSEKELFEELISITNSTMDRLMRIEYNKGLADAYSEIKKLPWYKRLFNLF